MSRTDERASLRRVLGLPDVVLMGINGVIGSGIFLLPGAAAALMGPAAILPLICAGILCVLIALCFAEVGGRFGATGGAYLYAREVFGGFIAFSVGWMSWWVRIIAWAALANGFAVALLPLFGEVPASVDDIVVVAVIVVLSIVNFRGTKLGAVVMNVLTIAKLIPLAVFVIVGLFFLDGSRFTPFAPEGYGSLAETVLVLLWAFVGFEVLAVPAGEMRRPNRTVPLAFVTVMAVVTLAYVGVLVVATGTYDDLAGSENPVAEAAATFLGSAGGTFVAVGIAISIIGTNAASALVTPRCLYALAEQRQMPAIFGAVHATYRTPSVAIIVSSTLVLVIALSGSFVELAVISVVARFFQYIPTCIGVLVLRRRDERAGRTAGGFRVPLGATVPVLATLCCVVLLALTEPRKLLWGGGALVLGIPFYFLFRSRETT